MKKGSEFQNISFKKWSKDNEFEMHSIHNEGKSVVAERFIRTLKTKIYKYMTSISKNVYIDKLDDMVNEHNNTLHRTIKMKPVDVKDNTYIESTELHSIKEVNYEDPKFKVGDLKNISYVDTSSFALKSNIASLKTEVGKLDIDKLVPVPDYLSKLSDVAKDVVKKTVYDKLVAKVNSFNTSRFVLKNMYDTDKSEIENKIPDASGLVRKTDYNAKITEIEGKIPSISGLATNAALTAVENKIPNISSLVKKTDYNTKITEIEKKLTDHNHDKYIATPEFNTLATYVFNAILAQANLIRKMGFVAKLSSLTRNVTTNQNICLLKMN